MDFEGYELTPANELDCSIPNEIHVLIGEGGTFHYGVRFMPFEYMDALKFYKRARRDYTTVSFKVYFENYGHMVKIEDP